MLCRQRWSLPCSDRSACAWTARRQVPHGKQRILLAVLLLNAGRVVSADDLTDTLWESAPPVSARATLQNYVKRLRATLGDTGHRRISTVPPGYSIQVGPGELDVHRFESLLAAGREAAGPAPGRTPPRA